MEGEKGKKGERFRLEGWRARNAGLKRWTSVWTTWMAIPLSLTVDDPATGSGCQGCIRTEAGVLREGPFQLFTLVLQVATASAGAA